VLGAHLAEVAPISLDHDLPLPIELDGRRSDPGTGRMVADYLAYQPPVCPVIVHSSNDHFAPGMLMVLLERNGPAGASTPSTNTAGSARRGPPRCAG
jgi:NAD+-processing family protein with receiver domain